MFSKVVYEVNSVKDFYEEHKTAINIAIGVGIIAICAVGMVVTGPMGCCLMATAAKGAFYGSLIGGAIGVSGGAINGAANYMEEHGTLDGSGGTILEGAAAGFAKGTKTGAEIGYSINSMRYMKNPNGFCFVAGTLVLTAIGLTCIEDIRPGDYVYAKNEITGEQDYMPVLETFENEVTELCTVTIDGNSIETTPGHKFYTPDNGWVSACDLKNGDTVELSDGSSAEVDSVETTELEEPITVYNFNVMDYHTYYVGESEVLVHNTQCKSPKVNSSDSLGNYTFKEGVDIDLRGQGTHKDALEIAFEKTGLSKDNFEVKKWGKDKNGKSFPVEWKAKNGAEVNIDLGHSPLGEAPAVPHVGWQTGGKRGLGGAVRGHIFLDEVPYNR